MSENKPTVKLIGLDGNAWGIMGRVKNALKDAGRSSKDINIYMEQAMSGDYNNLLRVTMEWVNVV